MKAIPRIASLALLAALASPLSSYGQKTIKLKFDSTNSFVESCGGMGTATPSGFSADDKATIIKKVQAKYDAALGTNKVMVMEGTGGDVDVIIDGGLTPAGLAREYGDAGKPGKPGVVHTGEFTNDFAGAVLLCVIGETTAHEAGHKFGLPHNCNTNPPTLMTEGAKVSITNRQADGRSFTSNEVQLLNTNLNSGGAKEQKTTFLQTDLGIFLGHRMDGPMYVADDHYLDVHATFGGPAGTEFGYLSIDGTFVCLGSLSGSEPFQTVDTFMTFIYNGGANLAVRSQGTITSLASGGQLGLAGINPDNTNLAMYVSADYNLGGGNFAFIGLGPPIEPTTGGFFIVPPIPQITHPRMVGGNFVFDFATVPNRTYVVERADDPRILDWAAINQVDSGTGGIYTFSDPLSKTKPAAFYRVDLLLP